MKLLVIAVVLGMLGMLVVSGCESRPGPTGPVGPRGATGPIGPAGPEGVQGPPGATPALPVYTIRRVDAASSTGIAQAPCPSGTFAIGGGVDCLQCSPTSGSAVVIAAGFTNDTLAFAGGCYPGCVHVTAQCIGSTNGGTLIKAARDNTPAEVDVLESLRATMAARDGTTP